MNEEDFSYELRAAREHRERTAFGSEAFAGIETGSNNTFVGDPEFIKKLRETRMSEEEITRSEQIIAQAQKVRSRFELEWGTFRRWIAANPLTGFWSGVGIGIIIGALVL